MNIPDEVIEQATVQMYEARPLDLDQEDDEWGTLPDDWKEEWREGARVVAEVIAEWARKEALDEVLCEAEKNRVIMVTHHAGYTVENYADPLVKIAVLRALAEGVRS